MDPLTVQYGIAILGIALGLAGMLLPAPAESMKLARIFGAVMLAAGLLIGFATMAFGDLDLL